MHISNCNCRLVLNEAAETELVDKQVTEFTMTTLPLGYTVAARTYTDLTMRIPPKWCVGTKVQSGLVGVDLLYEVEKGRQRDVWRDERKEQHMAEKGAR